MHKAQLYIVPFIMGVLCGLLCYGLVGPVLDAGHPLAGARNFLRHRGYPGRVRRNCVDRERDAALEQMRPAAGCWLAGRPRG